MELKMFNERLIFFNKLHQVPIHGRLSSVIRRLSSTTGQRSSANRQPSTVIRQRILVVSLAVFFLLKRLSKVFFNVCSAFFWVFSSVLPEPPVLSF